MKRLLLSLLLVISFVIFLSVASFGQTLDNARINVCNTPPGCQETPICTLSDQCFQFDLFSPKDQGNGTSILKIKITNFSESTFKQAAFELPGNGAATHPAVSPTSTFSNRYNHSVINPANDSMIVFNAKNAGTFSYGGFEVYYYVVQNSDLNAPSGRNIVVNAQAGRSWQQQRTGTVKFNIDVCQGGGPGETACLVQENEHFKLMFPNFAADAQDNAAMNFTIINKTASDVNSVSIDASSLIVSPLNGSSYQSPFNNPFYTYNVHVGSPLIFTGTTTAPGTVGYANGLRDVFNFSVVNTDFGNTGALITVIVNAGAVQDTFFFECAECGDFPINPLPVTLVSFRGKPTSEGIALHWATATEQDNDRFEIERSSNGKDFEYVASMKGSGNSSSTLKYDFVDKAPLNGANYYRLKQVDFDGKHEYSKVINVKYGSSLEGFAISMSPNPCPDGSCSLRLKGTDNTNPITVELRDLTGRLVYSKELAKDQTTFSLPKVGSGAGIYMLHAKNGQVTAVQKVILQ